jgi:hypothetical protein
MFNAFSLTPPASQSRTDRLQAVAAILAVVALGAGTATAAISAAPVGGENPALRPLTIGSGVHVQRAYGPDDEDCVWATRKVMMQDGKFRLRRKLECAQ